MLFHNVHQFLIDKSHLRVVGLMSGTSMDGLDICVADIDISEIKLDFEIVHFNSIPFGDDIRDKIRATLSGTTAQVCSLNYELGCWYAQKVKTELEKRGLMDIDLIGSHGQTLHHINSESTLQVGEPSFLAQALEVPVIADFRAADIAAGGTGAPLIPRIDEWLFRQQNKARIALNIGGVANVTLLPPKGNGTVLGFDTGPGMALLDELYYREIGFGIDLGGHLAQTGQIKQDFVAEWLKDNFISAQPPKSTGRDKYGMKWLKQHNADLQQLTLSPRLATLAGFTAESIYTNCKSFLRQYNSDYLIVSGGGIQHAVIMKRLRKLFNPLQVVSSDHFGVEPAAKEALGFAVLAVAFIKGIPGNLPAVTGARKSVILGKLII